MGAGRIAGLALLLLAATSGIAQIPPPKSSLQVWRLEASGFQADPEAGDAPLPVGSIQKPFVAKAWALAHPQEVSPRYSCTAASRCWLRSGHGELGLTQALAASCNTYFRRLAEATPLAALASTLAAEGFSRAPLSPDTAIGLPGAGGLLTIRPSILLEAYVRLVRSPWSVGESIRQQVLAGLREAALTGTAALGQRGYWAKTGTVPLEGDPLHTSGYALAVEDSGWAILARLPRGSGREAAEALGEPLARLRPWNMASPAPRSRRPGLRTSFNPSATRGAGRSSANPKGRNVRIRLLELLPTQRFNLRNLGPGPIPTSHGYLGPGGSLTLHPGLRIGPGLVEIQAPSHGIQRRIEGELRCERAGNTLRLIATLPLREYADGVVAAELPYAASERRITLGATILRFLDQNHRHADADVCDSTHCAWFIGRGPQPEADRSSPSPRPLSDAEWSNILATARQPGPCQWTSHCGGLPLSPHALWGFGDSQAPLCPRHGPGLTPSATRPWVREWRASDLARAFGAAVDHLALDREGGVWTLQVSAGGRQRHLRYDEAHRTLASILGWGALPSPADGIEPTATGFRATGVGLGHRVGLCLGE